MKRHYNILDEIRAFVDRKPDYVPDSVWEIAVPEVRSLLIEVAELRESLSDAFLKAVRKRDWNRALVIPQFLDPPSLYCINSEICEECECHKWREGSPDCVFVWLGFAEELLGIPDRRSSP